MDWQPIETAPKDTPILLMSYREGLRIPIKWIVSGSLDAYGSMLIDCINEVVECPLLWHKPTHWAPRPKNIEDDSDGPNA